MSLAKLLALIGLITALLAALVVIPRPPNARGADTATRWDSFSESTGCGEPFTRTPYVSKKGWLSNSERILGPFGTYFGRSIGEIRSRLVDWTVPGSGGQVVQVHQAMLPALKEVEAGLAAEAAEGNVYRITAVHAFSPRTIGGAFAISRHGLGLAIDINPARNPYRSDARLITDMPGWFVDVWRDAGFCWGGDWKYAKDAMHFSWIGPQASWSGALAPMAPYTSLSPFGPVSASHPTQFSGAFDSHETVIADGTGNGAPDVVGVRAHPGGSVIDLSTSNYRYGECSVSRWFVGDPSLADSDRIVFGDADGDSSQDLIAITFSDNAANVTVRSRRSDFTKPSSTSTGLSSDSPALAAADFDGDGSADLWEATADGSLKIWSGPGWSVETHTSELPSGVPFHIAAGDRDGGDTPELFAVYEAGSSSRIEILEEGEPWTVDQNLTVGVPPSSVMAVGAIDYDGDGRSDLQVLADDGQLLAYVGNTSTGVPATRWSYRPDGECDDPIRLVFRGTFFDDDNSIFESNIESIASVGVTRGCNPPFKDRYCPEAEVTRETMAAFLVRSLKLTANNHPGFVDVPADGTFAEDIGRLATAGITRGCNPPDNDRFCPKEIVTRETMAAFMVRALGLNSDGHPGFSDVSSGNIFAVDIERLATAGITRGCNPPSNDLFCPKDPVTRETMAAFLDRAGLGG